MFLLLVVFENIISSDLSVTLGNGVVLSLF